MFQSPSGLATVRKCELQPVSLGRRTSGHWRDFQACTSSGICQRFNGHRLFSWNEPGWADDDRAMTEG
jgi:hypothetical protein